MQKISKKMPVIKLTTASPNWPIARQLPNGSYNLGGFKFEINNDTEICDYWFVVEALVEDCKAIVHPNNVWLITNEPPAIRTYNPKFIEQFGGIITCQTEIRHKNVVFQQQALQWMTGARFSNTEWDSFKDFNFFESYRPIVKEDKISVIVSNKRFCQGHEKRLAFVEKLKAAMPEKLDIYGSGINAIPDKWDATAGYKYHLVLENSSVDDYWSEKLSDAYLAWCYPIYYGAPNIQNYFTSGALLGIDIDDTSVIDKIKRAIQADYYHQNYQELVNARNKILFEYNIFPYILTFIRRLSEKSACQSDEKIKKLHIRSEKSFSQPTLLQKLKTKIKRISLMSSQ